MRLLIGIFLGFTISALFMDQRGQAAICFGVTVCAYVAHCSLRKKETL